MDRLNPKNEDIELSMSDMGDEEEGEFEEYDE